MTQQLLELAALLEKHEGKLGAGAAVCREAAKRIEELEVENRANRATLQEAIELSRGLMAINKRLEEAHHLAP